MSDKPGKDELANLSNEELVEISNQMKERVRNQDWQRVVHDLQVSGHIHTYREGAPSFLQRFLRLEIDLDKELAAQSMGAPLMSSIRLKPRRPRGNERNMIGVMSSQDNGATIEVEVIPDHDLTVISFAIHSMLTLKFRLPELDKEEAHSFIDMMRRDQGMAVLWTRERWEQDFLVWVKEDVFTRVFAFSESFNAAARISSEVMGTWLDWIERAWFPRRRGTRRIKRTTQSINVLELSEEIPEVKTVAQQAPTATQEIPVVKIFKPPSEDDVMTQIIELLLSLDDPAQTAMLAVESEHAESLRPIFELIDQEDPEKVNHEKIKALMAKDEALLERLKEKLATSTIAESNQEKLSVQSEPGHSDEDSSKFVW